MSNEAIPTAILVIGIANSFYESPMREDRRDWLRVVTMGCAVGALASCQAAPPQEDQTEPHVTGGTDIERGRYVIVIGNCNDCHTEGYLNPEGDVPEDQWLLGTAIGFRGPWGTTYPANLRLSVQGMTEDQWVTLMRTRTALDPMPWKNVNQMVESDARAVYRYIVSLGAAGEVMPTAVPPGVEPTTPYVSLEPVFP